MRTSRLTILAVAAAAMSSVGALAEQSQLGTISRLDEASGTIAISESKSGTVGSGASVPVQEYKVQDGLLFNALKEGDRVSFTVGDVGGVKTLTNVQKQ